MDKNKVEQVKTLLGNLEYDARDWKDAALTIQQVNKAAEAIDQIYSTPSPNVGEDEVKEILAELQFDMDWGEENNFAMANASNGIWAEQTDTWFRNHYYKRADQILSLLRSHGYVRLDKDQKLPRNRMSMASKLLYAAAEQARQDMLNAGFRRVIL